MSAHMNTYSGMEGVKGGLRGPYFHTASGAVAALRKHRVTSAANDHGAITLWIDDAGILRAEFHRHWSVLQRAQLKSRAEVRRLLAAWLPATIEGYTPDPWPSSAR